MSKRSVENDSLIIRDENGKKLLSMQERYEDGVMNIRLDGNVTMNVAHDFEDELMAATTVCSRIVIDFSGVDVLVSPGLKTLLAVQKRLDEYPNASLCLKGIRPSVMDIFEETGFSELFEIELSEKELSGISGIES